MAPPISSWSHIPADLLHIIAGYLPDIADQARMRSVCTTWRSVYLSPNLPPQLPWLLFPSNPYAFPHEPRHFFSLSLNRVRPLYLPGSDNPFTIGSTHGWLLLASNSARSASLLNPITRTQIHLPSLKTLTDFLPFKRCKLCSCNMLMISFKTCPFVGFLQLGNSEWNRIVVDDGVKLCDFAYYKGLFFLLKIDGTVTVINGSNLEEEFVIPANGEGSAYSRYLVESSKGELLLVVRPGSVERERFEVYMLDFGNGEKKNASWVRVESIGEDLMFVDDKHAVCFAARSFDGFRTNCIYYTNVYRVCLYSIKGRRVEQLFGYWENFPYPKELKKAVWFVPALC